MWGCLPLVYFVFYNIVSPECEGSFHSGEPAPLSPAQPPQSLSATGQHVACHRALWTCDLDLILAVSVKCGVRGYAVVPQDYRHKCISDIRKDSVGSGSVLSTWGWDVVA